MLLWIEILDASGNKYGDGPITTATGWTYTRRLDAIGSFSFAMPAADPLAVEVQNKRYVRCWTAGDDPANPRDKPRELGAGIIEQIDLQLSDSGAMLNVSGVDLLSELGNVTVGDLALFSDEVQAPQEVRLVPTSGTTVIWTPDAIFNLQNDPPNYIYVKSQETFFQIYVDISSPVNTVAGTLKAQYYNAESSPAGWENLSITDGTKAGGKPFAQDGIIQFDPPPGWEKVVYGAYMIRLYSDEVDFSPVKFHNFTITVRKPTMTALADVMALVPAGWSLDPAGKLITEANTAIDDREGIYLQMNKESAMATLGTVAETLGEHFILSPTGRRVLWLGTDKTASGLRAIGPANPIGSPDAFTLYITDLQRTLDSYPLFNRMYVAGGGVGAARITLSDATNTAPVGYTLNTTEGWLQLDASVALYGRIDNPVDYPDIVALNNSKAAQGFAGNELLKRAYEELRRGGVLQEAYQLSVLPALYTLYPGSTIYVSYHEWVDGYHAVNIERELWVLDVTTQIAPSGAVHTVGLTVAVMDTYMSVDAKRIAQAINAGRASRTATLPETGLTDTTIGNVITLHVKNGMVTQAVKKAPVDTYQDGVYPPTDTEQIDKIEIKDGLITGLSWKDWAG